MAQLSDEGRNLMETGPSKRGLAAALAGIVLLFLLPSSGLSQSFGKNKVQYDRFEWYFIQSDHFDVYFDEKSQSLAEFTAIAAESAYTSITSLFRYRLVNRVPLIIYKSHN